METIIHKTKVLRVEKKDDYQEVFLAQSGFLFRESVKIRGCDKDIASLIKKTFWGRSKSEIELHVMGNYVVKIYLDGVLLCEKTEENYPEGLKKILEKEKQQNQLFEEKFLQWLQSYPKKENVEAEIFAFNDVILRAYVGACLDKVKTLGKWNDDLYQRRCSLFVDLMHLVEQFRENAWVVISWPHVLDCMDRALFFPNNFQEIIRKSLDLQNVDEQIVVYFACLIGTLSKRYRADYLELNDYWATNTSLFSDRKMDRALMIEFNKDLQLCQPWNAMPNFVLEEPLSLPEFKLYLSKQNW